MSLWKTSSPAPYPRIKCAREHNLLKDFADGQACVFGEREESVILSKTYRNQNGQRWRMIRLKVTLETCEDRPLKPSYGGKRKSPERVNDHPRPHREFG